MMAATSSIIRCMTGHNKIAVGEDDGDDEEVDGDMDNDDDRGGNG